MTRASDGTPPNVTNAANRYTVKPTQDEVNEYLDELRESGVTNMFGARRYILREFPALEGEEAGAMLTTWMRTFSERHPAPQVTP